MNYDKEEMDEIKERIITLIAQKPDNYDILSYFNNVAYIITQNGTIIAQNVQLKESYNEILIFKEYQKEYFIYNDITGEYPEIHNVAVEVLYTYFDKYDGKITVLFYSDKYAMLCYEYFDEDAFIKSFIPDYTKDNFKLIDGL